MPLLLLLSFFLAFESKWKGLFCPSLAKRLLVIALVWLEMLLVLSWASNQSWLNFEEEKNWEAFFSWNRKTTIYHLCLRTSFRDGGTHLVIFVQLARKFNRKRRIGFQLRKARREKPRWVLANDYSHLLTPLLSHVVCVHQSSRATASLMALRYQDGLTDI